MSYVTKQEYTQKKMLQNKTDMITLSLHRYRYIYTSTEEI